MPRIIRGVVHGRTIELADDPRLRDGESIEVTIRVRRPAEPWGEGLKRCAGALANCPEWDEIMEEIHKERQIERRPQEAP